MAAAMPAMGVTGGVIGGIGALTKGQMTANSLEAQAKNEEVQATEATQAGEFNVFRQQLAASQSLGRATAAYGASGVASNSVSEQSVLTAGAANAELERQNILHGADMKATNYLNQASLNRFGAKSALTGSYFSALSNVMGGGSLLASNLVSGSGNSSSAENPMSSADLSAEETSRLQDNLNGLNGGGQ